MKNYLWKMEPKSISNEKANEKYFKNMMGGLMYLTHTRPDLEFVVSIVSRYMHSPSKYYLGAGRAAMRILRYV